MKLVKNKLIADKNKFLIETDDIGNYDGKNYVFPKKYDYVFVGKQIDSIEKAKEAYKEINIDQYDAYEEMYAAKLEEESHNEEIVLTYAEKMSLVEQGILPENILEEQE